MRLSESIRRGVLETKVGRVINKFKVKKGRRDTFFFDDIGLNYVKLLEDNGYGERLRLLSYKWGVITSAMILPSSVKILPYTISCNMLLRDMYINIGYMQDIHFKKVSDIIEIRTKNEENVKKIGINNLHIGMLMGICTSFFNSEIAFLEAKCSLSGDCAYKFRIMNKPVSLDAKGKEVYNKLNEIPSASGLTIKNALKLKILVMKGNKIYFRGRSITAIENTLFHIFSNEDLMLDHVCRMSYEFFSNIIKESSTEKKLKLIKNLLQFMGWGIINFEMKNRKRIVMNISYPPFGIQSEKDNWRFLYETVRGYLWLVNKELRIGRIKEKQRKLSVEYVA